MLTDAYVHNFMAIGHTLIGKEYALEFPFKLEPSLFEETVNTEQKVAISSNRIPFNGSPKEPFFFSNLTGSTSKNAAWTLLNSTAKKGIQETGNFQTNKVNLWGWGHGLRWQIVSKFAFR
jgi:hypothetical protein